MISIKDYAAQNNVSYEAVRQQVNRYAKELEGHITKVSRTKYLDDEAVAFLDRKRKGNSEQENEPPAEEVIEPKAPADDVTWKLIEMLQKELDEKSEQLKIKDKQISELNERLAENSARLAESQQMLNQQQHLHAIAEQKVLALESKAEEAEKVEPKKKWWQLF